MCVGGDVAARGDVVFETKTNTKTESQREGFSKYASEADVAFP